MPRGLRPHGGKHAAHEARPGFFGVGRVGASTGEASVILGDQAPMGCVWSGQAVAPDWWLLLSRDPDTWRPWMTKQKALGLDQRAK